jgi:hypothetical protein
MSCNRTWSNISETWSSVKETWPTLGMRATSSDIWSNISETWVCFQDTWSGKHPLPPVPPTPSLPISEDGYNLAMEQIPQVTYEEPQKKKKKKKTIELTCIVGSVHFTQKKDTKEENIVFFDVKRIKFEITRLHEAQLSVTT